MKKLIIKLLTYLVKNEEVNTVTHTVECKVGVTEKEKLKVLIESERYTESKYRIQIINGAYYLKEGGHDNKYVDLKSYAFSWNNKNSHYRECKGTIKDVIAAFEYRVPVIEEIISQIEL